MAATFQIISISYSVAQQMVAAAVAEAERLSAPVCVAILGPRGELKAFANMDGAPHIAVDACRAKAYASLMGLGSGQLGEVLAEQPAMLASMASMPQMTLLGGGLPLTQDGAVIGAIGVGGGSTEQDIAIAEVARACLNAAGQ